MDSRILPDMGVKVAFQEIREASAGSAGVLVPGAAVYRDGEKDIVWVVAEGVIERRAVSVEGTSEEDSLIGAGLSAGEKVVVEAPDDLSAGDRVEEKQR